MTLKQEVLASEREHRQEAPFIEWNHVVRLPSGEFDRVNRFDYNLAVAAKSTGFIQLASTAWIRTNVLTVIGEA